jgi:methylenetetrahydrofolate dehydrogenase (NADP+)/methenyltetrahydrofolate cyclohydrolase
MSAVIICGKTAAKNSRDALGKQVELFSASVGRKPKLAVILVGEDPASQLYVSSKTKAALGCGMDVEDVKLPADVTQRQLVAEIRKLNMDESVDGILLQLPLPKGLDEFSALISISPEKDADGLHPYNQGLLMRGEKGLRPCTPVGCVLLAESAQEQLTGSRELTGLNVAICGRSILVGKPAALLFLEKHCSVEILHSRTKDLAAACRRADILVAAIGKPKFLGASHVKSGAIVIDVGINRDTSGKVCGDVDLEAVKEICAAITPVPGGVGPMTIAMLLNNTFLAACSRAEYYS